MASFTPINPEALRRASNDSQAAQATVPATVPESVPEQLQTGRRNDARALHAQVQPVQRPGEARMSSEGMARFLNPMYRSWMGAGQQSQVPNRPAPSVGLRSQNHPLSPESGQEAAVAANPTTLGPSRDAGSAGRQVFSESLGQVASSMTMQNQTATAMQEQMANQGARQPVEATWAASVMSRAADARANVSADGGDRSVNPIAEDQRIVNPRPSSASSSDSSITLLDAILNMQPQPHDQHRPEQPPSRSASTTQIQGLAQPPLPRQQSGIEPLHRQQEQEQHQRQASINSATSLSRNAQQVHGVPRPSSIPSIPQSQPGEQPEIGHTSVVNSPRTAQNEIADLRGHSAFPPLPTMAQNNVTARLGQPGVSQQTSGPGASTGPHSITSSSQSQIGGIAAHERQSSDPRPFGIVSGGSNQNPPLGALNSPSFPGAGLPNDPITIDGDVQMGTPQQNQNDAAQRGSRTSSISERDPNTEVWRLMALAQRHGGVAGLERVLSRSQQRSPMTATGAGPFA